MNVDPLDAALKNVAETKHLLESVIISSENFDYHGAKVALKQLQKKVRDLGKLQAQLESMRRICKPNVEVVNFRAAANGRSQL